MTTTDFINKAIEVHGNIYDYSLVKFINWKTKIIIVCSIHGEFTQLPGNHINKKNGCPKCKNRFSTSQFIAKAIEIHGDKYDYSLVNYTTSNSKVSIICKIHGVFQQTPFTHLQGHGCTNCKILNARDTKEEFIAKAIEIHGDKYDYSLVNYITSKIDVNIICKLHGVFQQIPSTHLQGSGCLECKISNQYYTSETFIAKAIEIHGDKYDYSLVNYIDCKSDIKLICKIHGEFEQQPFAHLQGRGCINCSNLNKTYNRDTKEEFIVKAIEIHGDKYDYSLVNYYTSNIKVDIICKTHGVFQQTPSMHIQGQNCSKCIKLIPAHNKSNTEQFIKSSQFIHGNTYDYSLVDYIDNITKVKIICKIHGKFEQRPKLHLQGHGCFKCNSLSQVSKAQNEVYEYICSIINPELVILEDRQTYTGLQLDITIPSLNLAIEYNGVYHHAINNERYRSANHLNEKRLKAKDLYDLRIINIYEDEWSNSQLQIKQIINNALGIISTKIAARKCTIWTCNPSSDYYDSHVKPFFDAFHHQGLKTRPTGIVYSLVYEGEIVAMAYFGQTNYHANNACELIRYATRCNIKVQGGLSKLIKNFTRNHPTFTKMISYCDNRFFTGESYLKVGFKKVSDGDVGFAVINKVNNRFVRRHRSCIIKSKLTGYFTQEELDKYTQQELAFKLNWLVVPDCGHSILIWEKSIC